MLHELSSQEWTFYPLPRRLDTWTVFAMPAKQGTHDRNFQVLDPYFWWCVDIRKVICNFLFLSQQKFIINFNDEKLKNFYCEYLYQNGLFNYFQGVIIHIGVTLVLLFSNFLDPRFDGISCPKSLSVFFHSLS